MHELSSLKNPLAKNAENINKMSQWWEKYVGKIVNAGIFFPEEDWLDIRSTYGNKL